MSPAPQEGPGGRSRWWEVAPKWESQAGGTVTCGARTKCQALPGSLAHGALPTLSPHPRGSQGDLAWGTELWTSQPASVQSSLSFPPTDPFDVCSPGTGLCVKGGLRPTAPV